VKLFELENCEACRVAGGLPVGLSGALKWRKGDSSSQTSTASTATNQNVAVDGGGTAYGANTASGANSTAVSGGSSLTQNSVKTSGGAVTINNTSSDPAVITAALNSESQVTANALEANTITNEDASANLTTAEENIATLSSQVISAFTGANPEVANGLDSVPAGGTVTGSVASGSGDDSQTEMNWILIGSAVIGLIFTVVVFYKSKGRSA
jgi:hypothetical protein